MREAGSQSIIKLLQSQKQSPNIALALKPPAGDRTQSHSTSRWLLESDDPPSQCVGQMHVSRSKARASLRASLLPGTARGHMWTLPSPAAGPPREFVEHTHHSHSISQSSLGSPRKSIGAASAGLIYLQCAFHEALRTRRFMSNPAHSYPSWAQTFQKISEPCIDIFCHIPWEECLHYFQMIAHRVLDLF